MALTIHFGSKSSYLSFEKIRGQSNGPPIERAPTVYIHPQKELENLLRDYRRQSEQILEKCEAIGNDEGVEVKTTLIEGDVASKIAQYSEKELFDMIVMGYRGSGRFKKMVLGSVSEKVLHQAKHSVLIVR